MENHLDLREANKNLLRRLRKSQQDIFNLIVAAKHSNPEVLSPVPLTSTVNQHNRPSETLKSSGRLILEAKKYVAKSPSPKRSTKYDHKKPDLPSPVKSPKLNDDLNTKYPLISEFLESQNERKFHFTATPCNEPLLTNPGNTRPYRATETMKKPKSILLTSQHQDCENQRPHVTFKSSLDEDSFSSPIVGRNSPPLLGYDWIAGLVENESEEADFSDSYLEEIGEFRKTNRSACHSKKQWNEIIRTPKSALSDLPKFTRERRMEKSPDPSDTRDPRIVNYTINKRLFPVPVDPNDANEPGTAESPRYIRVSIPKSALMSPHRLKLKQHKNSASNGADSLSITDHCMMGWQTKAPARIDPTSETFSTLDLRASMRPQESIAELQLKSGQAPVPQVKVQRKQNSFLDESYSIQYKLLKMRNQIRS